MTIYRVIGTVEVEGTSDNAYSHCLGCGRVMINRGDGSWESAQHWAYAHQCEEGESK